MGLFYFFIVGIIFTLMSLEHNSVFTPKKLLINKYEKATSAKVIFGVLTAWFFAANALLFFYLSNTFIHESIEDSAKLVKTILKLVNYVNILVMPFLLFKRMLEGAKGKQ
jgi:hypothetical protein